MKRVLDIALATLLLSFTFSIPKAEAARCSDFAYQEDAQVYYERNGANELDRDRDGVACEALSRRGSSAVPSRPANSAPQSRCASFVPTVAPWRLQEPVLMGNARSSYYYEGVILAGDTEFVQSFLDCYDLTVKYRVDYASARPIWGACTEVTGAGQSQTVCVAVDSQGIEADERIFSAEYANRVARTVFNLN